MLALLGQKCKVLLSESKESLKEGAVNWFKNKIEGGHF